MIKSTAKPRLSSLSRQSVTPKSMRVPPGYESSNDSTPPDHSSRKPVLFQIIRLLERQKKETEEELITMCENLDQSIQQTIRNPEDMLCNRFAECVTLMDHSGAPSPVFPTDFRSKLLCIQNTEKKLRNIKKKLLKTSSRYTGRNATVTTSHL